MNMSLKNLEHAVKNICLAKKIKLNKVQEVIVEKHHATKMFLNSHFRIVSKRWQFDIWSTISKKQPHQLELQNEKVKDINLKKKRKKNPGDLTMRWMFTHENLSVSKGIIMKACSVLLLFTWKVGCQIQGIQQSLTQAIALGQKHLPHVWERQPRCFGQALWNCLGWLGFMGFQQGNNTLSSCSTTCAQKKKWYQGIQIILSHDVFQLSKTTR